MGRALTRKLAHLYHYYAHPESCPVFNMQAALTQGAIGACVDRRMCVHPFTLNSNPKTHLTHTTPTTAKRSSRSTAAAMALTGGDGGMGGGSQQQVYGPHPVNYQAPTDKSNGVDLYVNVAKGHSKEAYDYSFNLREAAERVSLEARYLQQAAHR